jgi:hypothetical protein
VTYTLTLIATGDQVFSNTLQTHSSYNYLSEGYYANTVSEQASERSCLEVLANLMALDLGMFFLKEQRRIKLWGPLKGAEGESLNNIKYCRILNEDRFFTA